jgi:hypothetical protein
VQIYIFFWIYAKKVVILQPISEKNWKSNVNINFLRLKKIMKKVLFLAAVAMCAMACGNKAAENAGCNDTVANDTVAEVVADTVAQ